MINLVLYVSEDCQELEKGHMERYIVVLLLAMLLLLVLLTAIVMIVMMMMMTVSVLYMYIVIT